MREASGGSDGLPAEARWEPRARHACVFCARLHWREDLDLCFLAGPQCFMKAPALVAKLLAWETYHAHWPDIPAEELRASAVHLR
eukprot:11472679-Alexandrium_andersonii.AAC.1